MSDVAGARVTPGVVLGRTLKWTVLGLFLVFTFVPLLWLVISSFKTNLELTDGGPAFALTTVLGLQFYKMTSALDYGHANATGRHAGADRPRAHHADQDHHREARCRVRFVTVTVQNTSHCPPASIHVTSEREVSDVQPARALTPGVVVLAGRPEVDGCIGLFLVFTFVPLLWLADQRSFKTNLELTTQLALIRAYTGINATRSRPT